MNSKTMFRSFKGCQVVYLNFQGLVPLRLFLHKLQKGYVALSESGMSAAIIRL